MKEERPSLRRALIISGAFNILFVSLFFYWLTDEPGKEMLPHQTKSTSAPHRIDKLTELSQRSFDELVQLLKNEERIDGNYLVRDFALALLVNSHDFDIERALSVKPFHRTHSSIKFYPGLTDEQFTLLYRFGTTELSPLTFKGVLSRLKENPNDTRWKRAFLAREEYRLFEKYLLNTPHFETVESVIQLLLEGDEALIGSLMHYEGVTREVILQRFLAYGSPIAKALAAPPPPIKAQEIAEVENPTRPKVQIAARKETKRPQQETSERFHKIVEGDTLWKISRKYGCDLDKIRKINHLKSDALKPGKILKIP